MKGYFTILMAFGLIFVGLLYIMGKVDDGCEKSGGKVIVVREKQAKGTFNHTECQYAK